ncbi:hypothetical protein RGQ15_17195 [Paracoccus sp. MBLB3053]|uniref:Pyridoxamine 5'-phosphate oxidase putative domain-containing protein n=1 Tax=Paracoccus aurantius TaxID=3073814 RepID=A0ABU2HW68_9RHOB|nr:hypothetical protein [Paracoccus sp. MBLB3053]MDS9469301.1 hypothetical protein [Paracoccus sp. MBLB3053]
MEGRLARSEYPASPAQEAIPGGEYLDGSPLRVDLAQFVQSGISVILGSVDRNARPVAAIGLACRVLDGGVLRVIARAPAITPILASVAAGSGIAVTFSRPVTHRSIQFKSDRARIVPAEDADWLAVEHQTAIFRQELLEVGHDEAFADYIVMCSVNEVAVFELTPDHGFVQTPGPGAGAALAGRPG